MQFELTDSRRLTGANLYWEYPSAIIDVSIKGASEEIITAWEQAVRKWLDPVGYAEQKTCYRVFDGGASLLISAPIDVLYSMCELNETAWSSAVAAVTGGAGPDPDEETPRLVRLFDEERNPPISRCRKRHKGTAFLFSGMTMKYPWVTGARPLSGLRTRCLLLPKSTGRR